MKKFIKNIWEEKDVKPQDIRRILITNVIKKNICSLSGNVEDFIEELAEALNTGVKTIYLSYDRSIRVAKNVSTLNTVHERLLSSEKGKKLNFKLKFLVNKMKRRLSGKEEEDDDEDTEEDSEYELFDDDELDIVLSKEDQIKMLEKEIEDLKKAMKTKERELKKLRKN